MKYDKGTLLRVLEIAYEEFDECESVNEQNVMRIMIDRIVELIES